MERAERHYGGEEWQEYYVHTPSLVVRHNVLYPMQVGLFSYPRGSFIDRDSFDSFLVMLVLDGAFEVRVPGFGGVARSGHAVLLDCYARHRYQATEDSHALWLHFDGPSARFYYDRIVSGLGNVFEPDDHAAVRQEIEGIHRAFASGRGLSEMDLCGRIVGLLTRFALQAERREPADSGFGGVRDVMAYIRLHPEERLSADDLAALAHCSPRTLSRAFLGETGYTVHAYVMEARLNAVKSRLVNTDDSLARLCAVCGFSSPSALCAAFKKAVGMSPMDYRERGAQRFL